MAKVSRSMLRIWAVGGSDEANCERRAWTNCSDWMMSTFQLKKRLISEEPREVLDLIVWMPGTPFIASSMGRVTETRICGAEATPVSTRTTMRRNGVAG